jgi:hypothetical protein
MTEEPSEPDSSQLPESIDEKGQKNPVNNAKNEHHQPNRPDIWNTVTDRQRHLRELVVLALYFAYDGLDVWTVDHGKALLEGLIGIIAVLAIEVSLKRLIPIGVALGCCAYVVDLVAPPILPSETESHGWLMPANEPTPPNGCTAMGAIPADALLVIAGTNGAWTTSGHIKVITVGTRTFFSIERDGSRLAINADIHDESGNLIARIEKNKFHLVPGEMSYPVRSETDRSKLTVYGKTGDPIFYVDYANPRAVLIKGVFVAPNGVKITVDDQSITDQHRNRLSDNCAGVSGTAFAFYP